MDNGYELQTAEEEELHMKEDEARSSFYIKVSIHPSICLRACLSVGFYGGGKREKKEGKESE